MAIAGRSVALEGRWRLVAIALRFPPLLFHPFPGGKYFLWRKGLIFFFEKVDIESCFWGGGIWGLSLSSASLSYATKKGGIAIATVLTVGSLALGVDCGIAIAIGGIAPSSLEWRGVDQQMRTSS